MGSLSVVRIAILINTDETPYIQLFKESFLNIFTNIHPSPTVTFYNPVVTKVLHDPSNYDFLIIGGGTYVVDEGAPWVVSELKFLKRTVRDYPKLKIVGICFGHQKISQAFGGSLGYNAKGSAELGITKIILTDSGRRFFPFTKDSGEMKIHELHRLQISFNAPGFLSLAENSQCCLSESNTILTFQGHPEVSAKMAKLLMETPSMYTSDLSEEQQTALVERSRNKHDGFEIWKRVLEWVRE